MSKLEDKIAKILSKNKIHYRREVSFTELTGLKNIQLRFDFAIYKNNKIIYLIEADGEQHYHYTKYFHKNIFNFKRAKEWDRRKNAFCLKKNIPLIRVPYWDYDKITLATIFKTPEYRVKNKFHNDFLINGGM